MRAIILSAVVAILVLIAVLIACWPVHAQQKCGYVTVCDGSSCRQIWVCR